MRKLSRESSPCFVWLKSVLFNLFVFLIFLQNAGSQLCFSCFFFFCFFFFCFFFFFFSFNLHQAAQEKKSVSFLALIKGVS